MIARLLCYIWGHDLPRPTTINARTQCRRCGEWLRWGGVVRR